MIKLAFASFGRPAPQGLRGRTHAVVWLLSAVFLTVSAVILIVLNFFSLPTGTFINFIGREGVRFRFLRLFGAVPAIAVTLPVLMGYALWHQSRSHGLLTMVWPMAAVWALGAVLIVVLALWAKTGSEAQRGSASRQE